MAGGGPGVEGPQAGEDGEADEDEGEGEHLEVMREGEVREFGDGGGACSGGYVGGDDADEDHR